MTEIDIDKLSEYLSTYMCWPKEEIKMLINEYIESEK